MRMVGKNLVIQVNGQPTDDVPEDEAHRLTKPEESKPIEQQPSPSSLTPRVISSIDDMPVDQFPMLNRVLNAFRQFEHRQRFAVAMNLNREVANDELIILNRHVNVQLDACTSHSACLFIMEILEGAVMTVDQRMSMLKACSHQVAMAHKFSLNTRFCPTRGDSRVVSFLNLYYDVNKLEAFFDADDPPNVEVIRPLCIAGHRAIERARIFGPTFMEGVAHMAIVVFEELERQLIVHETISVLRDRLYGELGEYLAQTHQSVAAASIRLIRLTSFVYENKTMTSTQNDVYSIADIFLPLFRQRYWKFLESEGVPANDPIPFPTADFIRQISESHTQQ
ncbi:hypothetical protein M3Y95_00984800 [Aphelenchoides besseyi]|nr:hypothetical protein M3Y95_00984800 [Aphelenchoides besseyi]